MIKKKAKSKTVAKRAAKTTSPRRRGKELNPAEVRKDIEQMVDSSAALMVKAVIDEGKKGQLATVKYLLEVAKIFPAAKDEEQATSEEDCLAKTLLHRLNLPEEPIVRDGDEEAVKATPPVAKLEATGENEPEGSSSRSEAGEESTDSVLV